MNAIGFDTLLLARKLEAAGFTPQQAQGAATAFSEVLGDHIATRRDLQDVRRELHTDIDGLRKDLFAMEARLRAEAAADAKLFRADLREMDQRLTIRLGAMLAAAIAVVAALVKLL